MTFSSQFGENLATGAKTKSPVHLPSNIKDIFILPLLLRVNGIAHGGRAGGKDSLSQVVRHMDMGVHGWGPLQCQALLWGQLMGPNAYYSWGASGGTC